MVVRLITAAPGFHMKLNWVNRALSVIRVMSGDRRSCDMTSDRIWTRSCKKSRHKMKYCLEHVRHCTYANAVM